MFYKHVLSVYRGDTPFDTVLKTGELSQRQEICRRMDAAMPFVLSPESLDLVVDLAPGDMDEACLLERLEGFNLPFPTTWIEYEDVSDEGRIKVGALVRKDKSSEISIIPFLQNGDTFLEPFCMLVVNSEDQTVKLGINPEIFKKHVEKLVQTGWRHEEALQHMQDGKEVFGEVAAEAAVYLREAILLMSAKNGPVDGISEPLMSRQERRAILRKGGDISNSPPVLTRIVLNSEGRAHVTAMREASDGRPRRAHWVRGHLMRSPTKGPVWRSAHVRGFGDPVMNPRLVTAAPTRPEPDEEMPSP